MIKVLLPLTKNKMVYHDNFFKAPYFGIFTINSQNCYVYCRLETFIPNSYNCVYEENPLLCANHGMCNQTQCTLQHLEEHYDFSKNIDGCDYVLADRYCETMFDALKQGGITLYKLSPFLQTAEIAIKNFLIGVSIASTLQHIHVTS